MNVHDSEHMAGMLEQAGYVAASPADAAAEDADVIVINTCAVRENAADKLYGNLGRLAGTKRARPGMQIAVGGCLAQKDRAGIVERAPWVDVVFGTHNLDVLPVLLERARHNAEAQVEIEESLKVFPSTLPTRRESVYAGWVSISVGCNNTCTFCIVPHLRGKERDRRPGEILAEVEALVGQGAVEVTLLGQNVNSYGVGFGDRGAFAKLLRAAGAIEGLERLRFTSPHPAAFTDDVIEAMAQTPTVMPQLHMPLQSGSDRILRAMRRSYRSDKFLGILDRVRAAMPDAAITTDIIVGFPGETEEDFAGDAARGRGVPVRLRVHVPVLAAPGHARRSTCPTSCRRPWSRSGTSGSPPCRTGSRSRRTSGRSAGPSRCWSPRPRAARTARRTGSPAAPRTTAWSTFAAHGRRGPAPRRPGRASTSPTPRRTTWSPTPALAPGGRFDVRRTRAGDAWDRRSDDDHSHGGAGDSCGTGGRLARSCSGSPRSGSPTRSWVETRAADRAAQLSGTSGGVTSSRGSSASSVENIWTPVPSPQASSWASWTSVTPGSKSADTSL